jgi:MraZ protein
VEQSGNKCIIFTIQTDNSAMINFTGDYSCRLDEKGRVLLPSAFIKQMATSVQEKFVVKKDIFESCLVLYPIIEWERQKEILKAETNEYNREHMKFLRGYLKGTAEISLDASNRLLIPRRLLDDIGADREIVLAGNLSRIEIWAQDAYDQIESGGENLALLAEKIMGKISKDGSLNKSTGE